MKFILYTCAIFAFSACQSLQNMAGRRSELSLQFAKEQRIGVTKQGEILSLLGKPDRIFDMSETNLGGNGKIWAYLAGGIQSSGRISFSFPANSDIVDSITWDVRNGDPEQNLEIALSQFKDSKFIKTLPKYWDNPHSSPDEVYYEDSNNGLTITYLKTPKRVTTISWVLSGRETTSELDPIANAPYPYCIADLCATPIRSQ